MRSDIIEPQTQDWSAWERWLRGHLDIELNTLHRALGEVLATERKKFRDQLERKTSEFEVKLAKLSGAVDVLSGKAPLHARLDIELNTLHRALGEILATERKKFRDQLDRKTSEFEVRLAKLSGAVDILRGAQPPPPAKFPTVKAWSEDTIYHEGEIVAFAGGTYQAQRDTARAPGSQDWTCLATPGKSLTVRGTYDSAVEYHRLDVVMVGGSSFAALKDAPGVCPGNDWHLLASRGSRGQRGDSGERGLMGLKGERGTAAPSIQSWCLDRTRYTATPIMSDGSIGPSLELRGLFEQFLMEVGDGRS